MSATKSGNTGSDENNINSNKNLASKQLLLNGHLTGANDIQHQWPSSLDKHVFSKANLRFQDFNKVQEKLKHLIDSGPSKLQVLADFDYTLSNFCCPDGSRALSTHALLENASTKTLMQKYLPIEYDRNMSVQDKIPHMLQWWTQSHKEIVNDNYDKEKLRKIVKDSPMLKLRSRFVEFFTLLEEFDVPLVIFSGGIGDVIQIVIEEACGKLPKNVHIISNWMMYDENEKVIGFKNPIVHSFNKNGSVIKEEDRQFFENLSCRPNILLMGDSLGDATMDVGLELEQVVFKLGFLNFSVEDSMKDYVQAFDIVCVQDETLDTAIAVLNACCTGQIAATKTTVVESP